MQLRPIGRPLTRPIVLGWSREELSNDRVLVGAANDAVVGRGNDTVSGSDGSDLGIGGGTDVITGSMDSELLASDTSNDTLRGGGDDDVLLLGPDLDSANGDAGNDVLVVTDDALAGFDTRLKIAFADFVCPSIPEPVSLKVRSWHFSEVSRMSAQAGNIRHS